MDSLGSTEEMKMILDYINPDLSISFHHFTD